MKRCKPSAVFQLSRLIEPSEIADTIVFCAESPVINGAVIHANLGQNPTGTLNDEYDPRKKRMAS